MVTSNVDFEHHFCVHMCVQSRLRCTLARCQSHFELFRARVWWFRAILNQHVVFLIDSSVNVTSKVGSSCVFERTCGSEVGSSSSFERTCSSKVGSSGTLERTCGSEVGSSGGFGHALQQIKLKYDVFTCFRACILWRYTKTRRFYVFSSIHCSKLS